jgi:predicted methyltransferase MtxX (methanogen marker protein 4)
MGGFELAPGGCGLAFSVDDPLPHIQTATVFLAQTHDDHDGVVLGRHGNTLGRRRAIDQRVVVVTLDELHATHAGESSQMNHG